MAFVSCSDAGKKSQDTLVPVDVSKFEAKARAELLKREPNLKDGDLNSSAWIFA